MVKQAASFSAVLCCQSPQNPILPFPLSFTNCESSLCLLSYRIDTTLKVEINWNFSELVAKHFPRKYFSFWLPRNTRSLCACEFSTTESSLGFRDSRKLNCWLSAHWQPITILGICWSMRIFQLLWNCLWIWPICHLPMRILRTSLEQIIMGWGSLFCILPVKEMMIFLLLLSKACFELIRIKASTFKSCNSFSSTSIILMHRFIWKALDLRKCAAKVPFNQKQ